MNTWLLLEPQDDGTIWEDELYHHGILGMKWGVRRFQPYGPGQKVKGGKEVGIATKVKQRVTGAVDGIKQHRAARKKAAQVKKAQATRKANADYQAAKKKAIESGSIEDLAKFKGDLTNEEYSKAFLRLQNEKKMSDMVDANKETMFDKIDKGMKVVDKLAGYANTVSNFKEKTDKLSDVLNKDKKEKEDKDKEKAKNAALTSIESITDLDRAQKELNLTADEYSKGLKILQTKTTGRKNLNEGANEGAWDNQDRKAERERAAQQEAANAEARAKMDDERRHRESQKEARKEYKRELNTPMDGDWRSADAASEHAKNVARNTTVRYREVGTNKTNQLMLTMKDATPSSYGAGKTPVGPFYKSTHGGYEDQFLNKKPIKGAKSGKSGVYTKGTGRLDFGDDPKNSWHYKRSGYKPSSNVEEMRRIVKETQEGKRKRKNFKP